MQDVRLTFDYPVIPPNERRNSMNETPSPSNNLEETFNQYMLNTLERSSDYTYHLKQQTQNTIQLLLSLITALIGGTIVIISTIDDETLKRSLISLILFAACGSSTLAYIWVLWSVYSELNERPIRFFLEKYFRDINPIAYEKYGLSRVFGPYYRLQDQMEFLGLGKSRSISLYALAFLASVVISAAVYTFGSFLLPTWRIIISIGFGVSWCIALVFAERLLRYRVKNSYSSAKEILDEFHNVRRERITESDESDTQL